jgi:hypothetical protein
MLRNFPLQTSVFCFWVILEDLIIITNHRFFQNAGVFQQSNDLSKFIFSFAHVLNKQTEHCTNKTLTETTKQTESQRLFDTELLNPVLPVVRA